MDSSSNAAKLRVVGVGGAGGNAINDMMESDITDVEFIAINTDKQDLDRSKAGVKLLLGKGTGAGADPEKGRIAAKESEEKIREVLEGTDMLFITAGMGGGTGTGASPVVAEVARAMGILTVAVVTKPFDFEGPLKRNNAAQGIENLKKHVDTLIAIPNQKLFELPNISITLMTAFKEANGILRVGIKGISDLITKQGFVNLDFADIRTTMNNSGIAMLGFGEASGDGKAKTATEQALNSPLLEKSIQGARKVLLNITAGMDIGLHEIREVSETVAQKTGNDEAGLIWGVIIDPELEGTIRVSIIATDFEDEEKRRKLDSSEEDVELPPTGIIFNPVKNEKKQGEKNSRNLEEDEYRIHHDNGEGFIVPPFFNDED